MKKIGVIGCGGTIGPIICSYLSSANVEIIGGQRSELIFANILKTSGGNISI